MLPEKFCDRMKNQLGQDFEKFQKCFDEPVRKAVRINGLKGSDSDFARVMGIDMKELKRAKVEWEESGLYCAYDENTGDYDNAIMMDKKPGNDPYHFAGAYYVQEPSAMLPVNMLDVDDSGLRVLDLCAAPGGKSTQIAAKMRQKGLLISNEPVGKRAEILSENIERMGVRNAVVISENPLKLKDRFEGFFDRILVDAPCSGEGMFRRVPEAVNEWSEENVVMCAERQREILGCAVAMLREGGKLVYSTCTFSEDEDEDNVKWLLETYPELELFGEPHKLYPHLEAGEGHFAAAFTKGTFNEMKSYAPYGRLRAAKYKDIKIFEDFAKVFFSDNGYRKLFGNCKMQELCSDDVGNVKLVIFKEKLCLIPDEVPSLDGIKVYRCGLTLGEFPKNRFEPNHALAMALSDADVKGAYRVKSEREALDYLKGMTIPNEDLSGWCLITADMYPLGLGKAAGAVIKNHYPKGLRIN